MALTCIHPSRLCDGCGACRPSAHTPRCGVCHRPIAGGEYYYEIDNRVLCSDCLDGCVKEA